jgi:Recombinase zinc beta ribbon domain
MGRFAIGILTLIAELELERMRESWSTAVTRAVERGVHISSRPPTGYVRDENKRRVVSEPAEFDSAQSTTKSLLKPRDGSLAETAMLGGLARCAACGHTLKITGNTDRRTGERYAIYYCTCRYASGLCPSRPSVRASKLDVYVEAEVLDAFRAEGGLLAQAVDASGALEDASRAVTEAEHELDLFVTNPKLLTVLGEEKFLEGVEARQQVLDEARQSLAELRTQSSLADELADGNLLRAWPTLPAQEKRRLLHGLLDRVVVARARGLGKNANPVSERTQVGLRGNVLLGESPDDAALSQTA